MDRHGRWRSSIWLDTVSRQFLDSGEFASLVEKCWVTGTTSNPTIFAKAITAPTPTTTNSPTS